MNPNQYYAVQTNNYFDVRSIVTIELAHVMYLGHNPMWSDSVSQANSCTWGSTRCYVDNDQGVPEYWTDCANCGQRWSRLLGDNAVLSHIYGYTSGGPTPTVSVDDDHVLHLNEDVVPIQPDDPDAGEVGLVLMAGLEE